METVVLMVKIEFIKDATDMKPTDMDIQGVPW